MYPNFVLIRFHYSGLNESSVTARAKRDLSGIILRFCFKLKKKLFSWKLASGRPPEASS